MGTKERKCCSSSLNYAAVSRDSEVINRKQGRARATQIFTFSFTDTPTWKENHQGIFACKMPTFSECGQHSLLENSPAKQPYLP